MQYHKVSLAPKDLNERMAKYEDEDLPMIGYWKLGLVEYHKTEENLFNHLLDYGNGYKSEKEIDFVKKGLLGSELINKIYLEKDPLTMILKVHLILESMLDRILKKNNFNAKGLSFNAKVEKLNKNNLLKEDVYIDLKELNKLRNKYAHDYFYDLSKLDITVFSICNNLYTGLPIKMGSTKAVLNLKTLQFFVIDHLLGRISYDFQFLNNVKVPRKSPYIFYKEKLSDKVEHIIRKVDEEAKTYDFGLEIQLKFYALFKNKKNDNYQKKYLNALTVRKLK